MSPPTQPIIALCRRSGAVRSGGPALGGQIGDQLRPHGSEGLDSGKAALAACHSPRPGIGWVDVQRDPPAALQIRQLLGCGLLGDLHQGGQLGDGPVGPDQVLEDQLRRLNRIPSNPLLSRRCRDVVGGRPPGEQRQQSHVARVELNGTGRAPDPLAQRHRLPPVPASLIPTYILQP